MTNPPLKCECEKPIPILLHSDRKPSEGGLDLGCQNCNLPYHPTTEPKELFCKNCGNVNKYCACVGGRNDTPPVEGEWEKEFDEKFPQQEILEAVDIGEGQGDVVPVGIEFQKNPDPDAIKLFITTLLHSEREQGNHEGYKDAKLECLRCREKAVAEERERIVKMCEERLEHWKKVHDEPMPHNTLIGYHADSCIRALSDLRDKLSTL